MERHSQQSSQRMQDRSIALHHTQPPPPPPLQHQPPPPTYPHFHHASTTQPPTQIPFSDPFRTRDPFMPTTAHGRRGSYGMTPGSAGSAGPTPPSYGERAWSAHSPAHSHSQPAMQQHEQAAIHPSQHPPPPSSAHAASSNPSAHMPYAFDSGRRRSLGGPGSPPRYPPGPQDPLAPPPPPPSFASRTMPPPSPTSGAPNSAAYSLPASRAPPAASTYPGTRDLSSFASRTGPGPSMSISSLIGSDSTRHGNHSPRTNATAPSPTIRPIHPPSPQRARSASIRAEQNHYGRPPSPASNPYGHRSHDSRPPPPLPPSHSRPPQDHSHSVPPQLPPFPQPGLSGFRPFQSSPSSIHGDEFAGHPIQAPPRPSSQPMQQPPPDHDSRHRQDFYDRGHTQSSFRPYPDQSGRPSINSQQPRPPHSSDRVEGMHDVGLNGHAPPSAQHRMSPHLAHTARSTPVPNGQLNGRSIPGAPYREEHIPGPFRPPYNPYVNHPPAHVPNVHREDVDYRGTRSDGFSRLEHRQSPTASAEMARYDSAVRAPPAQYAPPYGSHVYESHASDQHARRDGDGLHHRSLLGVSADIARQNGRSSPLPQAVQGAQIRHVGPGADPSIKSEFGRMFSGLGLGGVGSSSTPPIAGVSANGSATPSRLSPARRPNSHDAVAAPDNDGASTASRSNKRGRKAKDDGPKDDADAGEGRDTPSQGQQGNKRAKTTHAAPHHHHHHPHHHHHHHHNLAEEQAAAVTSPFNTLRFPTNPTASQAPAHHHHHHHAVHAHPPHHHHHTPKPITSSRQPELTISNQAVLSAVSKRPRKHLGTQLYNTKLGLPPRESTSLEAKLHFRSLMKPIPHFEDKANCTFTVRVPRGYLRYTGATSEGGQTAVAGGLEEICRTRAVWGTDIYTDDSDVVAAAVHSGWLRGDFGEFNDDIHDLFSENNSDSSIATLDKLVVERPESPIRALSGADLHITILMMPPLTEYAATTQNHIRSRRWGSDHDGMSYMIHSIRFVDESKTNRFVERTAASKHQRMADDMKRRNEAAESLMGLLSGGASVSVGA